MKLVSIRNNRDFGKAYTRGKSYVSPVVVTYVLPNRLNISRIGVTASKKIGNAVKRNRARRILKEAVSLLLPQIKPGYDLVLVARRKTTAVKMGQAMEALKRHLKAANLFVMAEVDEGKLQC